MDTDPVEYEEKMWRHLMAYSSGEVWDKETGESHLAHLVSDALIVMELRKETNGKEEDKKREASRRHQGSVREVWASTDPLARTFDNGL